MKLTKNQITKAWRGYVSTLSADKLENGYTVSVTNSFEDDSISVFSDGFRIVYNSMMIDVKSDYPIKYKVFGNNAQYLIDWQLTPRDEASLIFYIDGGTIDDIISKYGHQP